MTVAFDAFSNPTAGTGTLTWDHNPVGTPRGVIVFTVENGTTTDGVTGITYGGTPMVEVAGSPNVHSTGETSVVHCFLLGSSVPTDDPAEIVVSISGSVTRQAGGITVTAADDIEVVDSDGTINSDSEIDPSVILSLSGRTSFAAIGFHSGHGALINITPFTNWTDRLEHDFAGKVAGWYTYDIIGSIDVAAGWTQPAADAGAIALAVSEVAASGIDTAAKRQAIPGVGRPWMRGQFPSVGKGREWRSSAALSYPVANFEGEAASTGGKFLPLMGVG